MKTENYVSDGKPVNAAGRLDRLPVGRFHYRLFLLIAGGLFFDFFDMHMASGVATALLNEGFSTLQGNALFFSLTYVGLLIGALGAGVLGDRFGRRRMYQLNLAVVGIATLSCAIAPNMTWLLVSRFIAGVGLGAEGGISFAALAEMVPPRSRGKWLTGASLFATTAVIFSSVMGYWLLPLGHWRTMFVIAGVGALVFCILRRRLPESPRWLESKGRFSEAEQVLQSIEAEAAAGKILPPAETINSEIVKSESFMILFSKAVRRRTLVACMVNITVTFVTYGFLGWLPTMLMKQGHTMGSALGLSTLIVIGGPIGSAVAVLISDRVGRRKSLIILSFVNAVLGLAFAAANTSTLMVITGFLLVGHVFMMSTMSVSGYVPELFPTSYRMRGTAFSNAVGRFAAIIGPYVILFLFNLGGLQSVVVSIVGLMLVQAFVIFHFGIETTRLSLEEIAKKEH